MATFIDPLYGSGVLPTWIVDASFSTEITKNRHLPLTCLGCKRVRRLNMFVQSSANFSGSLGVRFYIVEPLEIRLFRKPDFSPEVRRSGGKSG